MCWIKANNGKSNLKYGIAFDNNFFLFDKLVKRIDNASKKYIYIYFSKKSWKFYSQTQRQALRLVVVFLIITKISIRCRRNSIIFSINFHYIFKFRTNCAQLRSFIKIETYRFTNRIIYSTMEKSLIARSPMQITVLASNYRSSQ